MNNNQILFENTQQLVENKSIEIKFYTISRAQKIFYLRVFCGLLYLVLLNKIEINFMTL